MNTERELLDRIAELEAENRQLSKFGLTIGKTDPEHIVEQVDNSYPYLVEEPEMNIDAEGKRPHILIEGDNYTALKAMQKTHAGKIDVIYIDPPYNTGSKDFVYNDSFVGDDDDWKHSKWLNFMKNRLELAKNLLSDTGIIMVSIDNNEHHRLRMLLDEIFGEANFVENFLWEKNSNPTFLSKFSRTNMEYILCYKKSNKLDRISVESRTEFEDAPLINKDNAKNVLTVPRQSIIFKIEDGEYLAHEIAYLDSNVNVINGKASTDVKFKGRFRWGQNYLDEQIKSGAKIIVKSTKFSPRVIYGENKVAHVAPLQTIDQRIDVGTNLESSAFLKKIGVNFEYSKPISLLKYLLSFSNKPNAIVLDFFSGSGSTGHAVVELNKEDNGNRQCILVTNNENNICRDVTHKRLQAVFTGEWASGKNEPVPGSLKFLRTELQSKTDSKEKDANKLRKKTVDLIRVKHEAWNKTAELENQWVVYESECEQILITFDEYGVPEELDSIPDTDKARVTYVYGDSVPDELTEWAIMSNPEAVIGN